MQGDLLHWGNSHWHFIGAVRINPRASAYCFLFLDKVGTILPLHTCLGLKICVLILVTRYSPKGSSIAFQSLRDHVDAVFCNSTSTHCPCPPTFPKQNKSKLASLRGIQKLFKLTEVINLPFM